MNKITNITPISLDGALCTILLMQKFEPQYKVLSVPIPMNRVEQVSKEAVGNWSKNSIVLITGINPPPDIVPKFKDAGINVFTRFAGKISGMPNVTTGNPEELTADLLLRTICRTVEKTNDIVNLVKATRDYETYELKHRASMGLNFLFKHKYRFEEYIERFRHGFSGFNDEEKTFIVEKEKELETMYGQVDELLWCGVLGKRNVVITPFYDYPNELAKHIYKVVPWADMVILLNQEKKYGSIRAIKTATNRDLGTTLDVFLTTYVSLSAKANTRAGTFTWTERDENQAGLPTIFNSFLKFDPELKSDNFKQ